MSINVRDLSFSYGKHKVLRGVELAVSGGELIAVLGPNGVGKSTLFNCILGLSRSFTGNVKLDGTDVRSMNAAALARQIAFVPQSHSPAFSYSVLDMVLMGTTSQVGKLSSPGAEQTTVAESAMERVGILHLKERGFAQLSGGERQLTLIARAIAQQSRIIVMDEPTANLDYGNGLRVLSRVRELARAGYAIVISTHNPDHAFLFADRVIAISGGSVLASGPPDTTITPELIETLYGVSVTIERGAGGALVCIPLL